MFNEDFVKYITHLQDKCGQDECSDELKDSVDLVISSMKNLPNAVEGSLDTFHTQIKKGSDFRLVSLRFAKLANLQDYSGWSLSNAQSNISHNEKFNVLDLLGDTSEDEDEVNEVDVNEVDEIEPIRTPMVTGGRPWLRNYKNLIDDGVLFPDEIIYYDEGDGRFESVLLNDGSVRSNDDGGKVMSIQSWINKYNKTKKPYKFAKVNRDGKLISVDFLRITSPIGPNAYKLSSGLPRAINVNGKEHVVSTWRGMLFDYVNSIFNSYPDSYFEILRLADQLSGITFKDEGKVVKEYMKANELHLDNGKVIYIVASRMQIIKLMAQIASWLGREGSKFNPINTRFIF